MLANPARTLGMLSHQENNCQSSDLLMSYLVWIKSSCVSFFFSEHPASALTSFNISFVVEDWKKKKRFVTSLAKKKKKFFYKECFESVLYYVLVEVYLIISGSLLNALARADPSSRVQ